MVLSWRGNHKFIQLLASFLCMGRADFDVTTGRLQNQRYFQGAYYYTADPGGGGGGASRPLPRDGGVEELHGDSTVRPGPKVWTRGQKWKK